MAKVVEKLPHKSKALSSNPSTAKKKKREERRHKLIKLRMKEKWSHKYQGNSENHYRTLQELTHFNKL
jgi:hypothetical protein